MCPEELVLEGRDVLVEEPKVFSVQPNLSHLATRSITYRDGIRNISRDADLHVARCGIDNNPPLVAVVGLG